MYRYTTSCTDSEQSITINDVQHALLFDAGPESETWEKNVEHLRLVDEISKIEDERFVMCNLRNKCLVMCTGTSHAGVVNTSKNAVELEDSLPLYAVTGGSHLSDAQQEIYKAQ